MSVMLRTLKAEGCIREKHSIRLFRKRVAGETVHELAQAKHDWRYIAIALTTLESARHWAD